MTFEERLEFLLRLSESNESNILRLHDEIGELKDMAGKRLTRLEEHPAKNGVLMTQVLETSTHWDA